MPDVLEFELHGAKVSIPAAHLIDSWLSKAKLTRNALPQPQCQPPRIGAVWPDQGGIYAGIMRGENGAPDYHLIHAIAAHELTNVNWKDACAGSSVPDEGHADWSLPDRREARLLFINTPDGFDADDWYWTSPQDAADDSYAWVQHFLSGDQFGTLKSNEYRARAVRRVLIIE
ncbi:DUF1566 domain-containing protein [Herminiimonas sp. CN]|uniref:Lcl C-terminal domain-containing protein n=1 Tax=Herminiimonas sp. CN TaxID=1349818 RepID=UPI00047408B4|nr:DUF1566 domain-containing protein [Herminiimonas sp. CN]